MSRGDEGTQARDEISVLTPSILLSSFAALNQHSKQLSKNNNKFQQDLAASKSREQARITQVAELKDELKMQKATYIAEVHSRLQYSKILEVVARTVEGRSGDPALIDEINAIVEDCERHYLNSPNGMTIDISRMKTPGRRKKKRRSLLPSFGSPKTDEDLDEDDEGLVDGFVKGLRNLGGFFGQGGRTDEENVHVNINAPAL